MVMGLWYYVDSAQNRQGPVEAAALVEAYRLGQVGQASLVWREGMPEWLPLQHFQDELGLATVAPVATPAPPVPPADDPAPAKKNNGCLIAAVVVIGGGIFLIFVLAILAAIALPAYQDYITRSKIAMVRMEGLDAKVAIAQFKANTDRCPRDAEELGLSAPSAEGLDDLAVGSLDDGRCAVELTLGSFSKGASVAGGRILMTLEEDGSWSCSADGIAEKYLPSDCR
jgi:type IV pilus assembly protein PilA